MKKSLVLLAICLLLLQIATAQTQKELYNQHVQAAASLYENKDFQNAAIEYGKAFSVNGGLGKVLDKYNAACCWSRVNIADSAFKLLYQIATKGKFDDYNLISTDSDLVNLHGDSRWQPILDSVLKNQKEAEAKMNMPLKNELDSIYNNDQPPRVVYMNLLKQSGGKKTPQIDSILTVIEHNDSIDIIKVEKILDTYGWLGADVVGQRGNLVLWLVIQHSDLAIQKKYQPMMEDAVKKGNLNPANYAWTIDRILVNEGEKQIYGSQLKMNPLDSSKFYVTPMIDPDNVDKRREEVDLPPIAGYVKHFGINWNVEEYKKNLPKYEEWSKESREKWEKQNKASK